MNQESFRVRKSGALVAVTSLALLGLAVSASAQPAPQNDTRSPDAAAPSPPAPASSTQPGAPGPAPSQPAAPSPAPLAEPDVAAPEAQSRSSRADLDRARSDLARARAQLEQAAREVARLSAEVSAPVVDEIRRRFSNAPWQRAMLGIAIENADRGARVNAVTPGGPADEAGIAVGDLILSIDGMSLGGGAEAPARELVSRLADVDPGDRVRLQIERAGETRDITVVAREAEPFTVAFGRPLEPRESRGPGATRETRERRESREARDAFPPAFIRPLIQPFFGRWRDMELVSLTPDLGAYFGASEGLLVVRAPKDASLPLHDGDVILAIGERKPTSPEHAMRILSSFEPGETLRLTIMRQRQQQTLQVELPNDGGTAGTD
jgi:C-terminal processing protease CtpA/Prc